MRSWMSILLVALPGSAMAGFPDNVSLTQLAEWQGSPVTDTAVTGDAYRTVVKELGVAVANKPLLPAETLGLNGFDVSLSNTWTFLSAHDRDSGEPAPWERVHEDGDPTRVLWIPTLSVRKGLPLSLEVGGNLGYVAFSEQTVFGAYGRWSVIEGYRSMAPDFTIQVGYSGYVGNEELELGVLDASATIGYTLPFGPMEEINQGAFSPYIGAGLVRMRAAPRLSELDQGELGIAPVSGWKSSDDYEKGFAPFQTHVGFQVRSSDFVGRAGLAWAPAVRPTLNFALGWSY